jgi:hypothetical protein
MTPHPARPVKLRHARVWGASVPNLTVQPGEPLLITTRAGNKIPAIVASVVYRGQASTLVSVTNLDPSTGASA